MAKTEQRLIRLGIVGCGNIARGHAGGYKKIRGARLCAFCDKEREHAEALRDEFAPNAKVVSDFDDMLESGVSAVSICTPNAFHYAQTMKALKAGVHVLCEKPIAGTTAEATRMIRAAEKEDRVLHVNQTMRYHGAYQQLHRLSRKDRLGELLHIRCLRGMAVDPDELEAQGRAWFHSREHHGGIVLDLGVHMADVLTWIGGPVNRVAAFTDSRRKGTNATDHASALFRFESGSTGVLELSWDMPVGGTILEVYGAKGRVHMDIATKQIAHTRLTTRGERTRLYDLKPSRRNSFQAFIDAVRGVAPTDTPGELGRYALALCKAIEESGATGRFVNVKTF